MRSPTRGTLAQSQNQNVIQIQLDIGTEVCDSMCGFRLWNDDGERGHGAYGDGADLAHG